MLYPTVPTRSLPALARWILPGALALGACTDSGARLPPQELHVPPFTVLGRWEDPSALRYELDPSGCPVDPQAFAQVVERALRVWSETGRVGFERAAGGPAQLRFAWDDGSDPEHSPFGRDTSVALTRGTAQGPTHGIGGACEVLFDGTRAWSVSGGADVDLYQTAVHEIGHALGLGHSEDERSVLYPQRENGRTVLGLADLAGIHTLYGGGISGPGDLRVGDGATVLRRVAPAGLTEWCVFDTDGDGDDEVLVWSVAAEHGALTAYHFAPDPSGSGPVLEHTLGPLLGVAGYGARARPRAGPDGARHLDVVWPDGSAVRRTFDPRGAALEPEPLTGDLVAGELRRQGDLDGDGRPEIVRGRP